jgi:hypothetical protein
MKIKTDIRKYNKIISNLEINIEDFKNAIIFFRDLSITKKYFSKDELERFNCVEKYASTLIQRKSSVVIQFLEAKLKVEQYHLKDSLFVKKELSRLRAISKILLKDPRDLRITYNVYEAELLICDKNHKICNITYCDSLRFWPTTMSGDAQELTKEEVLDMFPFLTFHLDIFQ